MSFNKAGKTGVTTGTPKNILFGAGTIHKNVVYTAGTGGASGSWNFDSTIIGATQGGSKLTITPEFVDVEADGALVVVKGLKVKCGETAEMEVNMLEITKDILKMAVVGQDGTSEDSNFDLIESKADLEDTDYLDNIAFVGQTLDGRNIIVIMDNVVCTSGLESDHANREAGVPALTFTCHADLTGDLQTLPYHIYYPKAT